MRIYIERDLLGRHALAAFRVRGVQNIASIDCEVLAETLEHLPGAAITG